MRIGVFLAFAVLALSGCDAGNSGVLGAVETESEPTSTDARQAIMRIGGALGTGLPFYPAGTPTNCAPGMMGAQQVRSCQVCLVMLRAETHPYSGRAQSLAFVRMDIPMTFRRAISYDQPLATPADDAQGVWAVEAPQQNGWSAPRVPFQIVTQSELTDGDYAQFGISAMRSGGDLHFSIKRPGHMSVFPNVRSVLEQLRNSNNALLLDMGAARVGKCDGSLSPK